MTRRDGENLVRLLRSETGVDVQKSRGVRQRSIERADRVGRTNHVRGCSGVISRDSYEKPGRE